MRTQILLKSYSIILRVEKQREVSALTSDDIKSMAAMVTRGYNYKKESTNANQYKRRDKLKKDNRFCSHCKAIGHTRDACFKIISYPD